MIPRNAVRLLLAALKDSPVVLLHGARQTGKSTLVRHVAGTVRPSRYITLDDATTLSAAREDPAAFLAGIDGPVAIDEVQRAPELFLAIKAEVDRKRTAGRFLLTGSANVLLIPRISESLAGRMEILTLWPFSQGELARTTEAFVDAVFARALPKLNAAPLDWPRLSKLLLTGGYPPAVARPTIERRNAWFGSYVTTILQRDVRDIANVEGLHALPRLLNLLAARTSSLLNLSEISRASGIPQSTLNRYFALFEATFLARLIPPWFTNMGKRMVKTPKVCMVDTGLAGYLLGLDAPRLAADPSLRGSLLETFVANELAKQASWSARRPRLFHFRQSSGGEVDLVLEDPAGRIVGVEVKASSAVTGHDFKGLRELQAAAGVRFQRGVVLYVGSEALSFGPRLHALPLASLWAARAPSTRRAAKQAARVR
jgi:predicted AAA+ superfamily ATPase